MNRIDPLNLVRFLHRLDVEVDHDRFVVAAHHHAFERLARAGVDFLVGYERRHIDEIARTSFGGEFQPLAPTHARLAAHHVDDALELAVVMCPGLGVGANVHGACPNLLGADAGIVDRSLAIHARRLRGVGIKRMPRNDAHAVVLPFGRPFAVGFLTFMSLLSSASCPARRGLHGYCPRRAALANRLASSAARNSALALSTHSCCSNLGLESATMPAPAWTYIVPSLINAVRSTMQLSSSPAAEK